MAEISSCTDGYLEHLHRDRGRGGSAQANAGDLMRQRLDRTRGCKPDLLQEVSEACEGVLPSERAMSPVDVESLSEPLLS